MERQSAGGGVDSELLPRDSEHQYDVCLSFAGENRVYVDKVARSLKRSGIRVFYDKYEEVALWGKDLYEHLAWVYQRAARYCVLFASREYADKVWTSHERKNAQARALQENREYILPVRFDDTEIPGLNGTVGHISLDQTSPGRLARLIVEKIGPQAKKNYMPPFPDRLYQDLGLTSDTGREEVSIRARSLLQTFTRMTEQERWLVMRIWDEGCPSELPDNIHINLDLLRRLTGLAPGETVNMIQGLDSLGFEYELREVEEHEEPMLVLRWFDYRVDDGLFKDNNATPLLSSALNLLWTSSCMDCAPHQRSSWGLERIHEPPIR